MAQRGQCTYNSFNHMSTCKIALQARAGLSPGDDAALREFAGAVAEWSRAMGTLGAGAGTCAHPLLNPQIPYPIMTLNLP